MPPPTTTAVSSKLVEALQQRGGPEFQNNNASSTTAAASSQSTPFQPRRRKTSFGVNPTPTRTPSMTLHHRRKAGSSVGQKPATDVRLLPRLEEENANLPPQDSSEFILAQIERQNALLDEDPKSVCIQSNELKAHLSTMQNLVSDLSDTSEEIDWEFWTALTEDFGAVATKLPHLLSAKLKAGIPSKLRGVIWQAMSQSASLHLETVYGQLVAEHSPYERIIQRDLARTFPNVDMFKQEGGDGQKALERVLKAYSLYDAHVGYCQGLAFLVGPLLMNMPEQQAFCVFVRLMETYELRTMFTLNMEGLQLRLYQFSSLLAQILPELSDHLAVHAVHPPMYASQWFLTLFAYAFPIPLVLRIYDIVFAEGAAETIMRVAIAILQRSQDEIMRKSEFEDILDYVTSKLHLVYDDNASLMINDAMALSGVITREKMDNLTDLYLREVEQEKKQTEQVLAVRFKTAATSNDSNKKKKKTKKEKRESASWLSKRSSSVSASSVSSGDESSSTKDTFTPTSTISSQSEDTAMLHQQIEDLLLALSQMQKDHIQMKQELVQERMDRMDVEAERDALKMTMLDLQQDGRIDVLSEIAKLKNQNMQLQQQLEDMQNQSKMQKEAQATLIEQMMDLKNAMERVESEKLKITKERDALIEQQEPIKQRLANAEKAAQELQLEKVRLLTDLEQEQNRNHARMRRRPTSVIVHRTKDSTLQESSSDERCHELEQMLADAKLRIAELETFGSTGYQHERVTSPGRKSFDPTRNNMQSMKRASFYGRLWSSVKPSQETPPTSPI